MKDHGKKTKPYNLQTERNQHLFLEMHHHMLRARLLEERLIKMYKQSDGYFWIGGPGEEAFNVPLGMLVQKGQGLDYDFLHLHYRSLAILLTMGMDPKDAMRQMKNTASDPFSGGRNFANHFSKRAWNVVPVTSTIETQYATAIGSGIAHKQHGGTGITIVNGGDAGTAEGEFASCLVWSSRPKKELPILIIVVNNAWGISTAAETQHGEKNISDRARAFGIEARTINGNHPVESYKALQEAFQYVRETRKPYFIEAHTSRLYGHSSATGCNYVKEEVDCLVDFQKELISQGLITAQEIEKMTETLTKEYLDLSHDVKKEPLPDPSTLYDFVYHNQTGRTW